jgi:hypothetical protein
MASKTGNPPLDGEGRARNVFSCLPALNSSEDKSTALDLQERRAVWLARRHALPLSMAHAVAGLAFPEREGAR